jgi:hypothetical protein
MTDAGARRYLRERDLPKLIALWPREIDDRSSNGALHILAKLRRALRAERTTRTRRPLVLRPQPASRTGERFQRRARRLSRDKA